MAAEALGHRRTPGLSAPPLLAVPAILEPTGPCPVLGTREMDEAPNGRQGLITPRIGRADA